MKSIMIILLLCIAIAVYAVEIVPGRAIIHSKVEINVLQTEPVLITDQGWFNDKIAANGITSIKYMWDRELQPSLKSARLYYYLTYDETRNPDDVVSSLRNEQNVNTIFPDMLLETYLNSNDEHVENMWGLDRINLGSVWGMPNPSYGDPDVIIAVLDTGIDLGLGAYPIHPDLMQNIWTDSEGNYGFNAYAWFLNEVQGTPHADEDINVPQDRCGHGTHVSGTIAALNNNSIGIPSIVGGWNANGTVTPGCKIMPIRCGERALYILSIWKGLHYAYENGASVINMSFGGLYNDYPSAMDWLHNTMIDIYNNYEDRPIVPIMIAAAGNNGSDGDGAGGIFCPAGFPEVISVSASCIDDKITNYSNYASYIDISAPGGLGFDNNLDISGAIFSTAPQDVSFMFHNPPYNWPQNYAYASGTSMACPHVSGVAALIISYFRQEYNYHIDNETLKRRLIGTVDQMSFDEYNDLKYIGKTGSGRLNAYKALTEPPQPALMLRSITYNQGTPAQLLCNSVNDLDISLRNVWIQASSVYGVLSTDDPNIVISYGDGSMSHAGWGSIDTDQDVSNIDTITITETGGYSRNVVFTLTLIGLDSSNMPFEKQLVFSQMFLHSGVSIVGNEKVNRYNVSKDLNRDGVEEVIVGTTDAKVIIYHKDSSVIIIESANETDMMECAPAIGDVTSNASFEIITGTSNQALQTNRINVFNYNGVLLNSYPVNGLVTSLSVSDVSGDGQLDIVATIKKNNNNEGVDGFVIVNVRINSVITYNTNERIFGSVSIDDMNNDGLNDIVVLCKDRYQFGTPVMETDIYLRVYDVYNIAPGFPPIYEAIRLSQHGVRISSYVSIADLDGDGNREMIFSYDHFGNIFTSSYLCVFNTESTNPVWVYSTQIEQGMRTPQTNDIIIGDFDPSIQGLETMYIGEEIFIIDSDGAVIVSREYQSEAKFIYALSYVAQDGTNRYLVMDHGAYIELDQNLDLLSSADVSYLSSMTANGMAFMKTGPNQIDLAINYEKGQFSLLAVDQYSIFGPIHYKQHLYNSMRTGSYKQALPIVVTQECVITNDVYLDHDLIVLGDVIVQPGVKFDIDPCRLVSVIGSLSISGEAENKVRFSGTCYKSTPAYWSCIEMRNNSQSSIYQAVVQNAKHGLLINDYGQHHISLSKFTYNDHGITAYNSSPYLYRNDFSYNQTAGLSLFHLATPHFGDMSSYRTGRNAFYRNPIGIYVHDSTPMMRSGHNDLYNNEWNIFTEQAGYIRAQRNWWGTNSYNEIIGFFNDPRLIYIDPWDSQPNTLTMHPAEEVFEVALAYLYENEYSLAIPYFKLVLEDGIEEDIDYIAITSLLVCYERTNNLGAYVTYLDQLLMLGLSNKFVQCINECYAIVNRILQDYDSALTYYTSVMQSQSGYQEQYAEIDLGNTTTERATQDMGKSGDFKLKPIRDQYEFMSNTLESLLKGEQIQDLTPPAQLVVNQNFPNPFSSTTTINVSVPKDGDVELTIYNIKGQRIYSSIAKFASKGSHDLSWNGKDHKGRTVGNGIYFYKVTQQNQSVVKKCIMIK